MMNYEEFKAVVAEQFQNHMPERFADYKVYIRPVEKINHRMDALQLIPPDGEKIIAGAIEYVDVMYQKYLETGSLQGVMISTAQHMEAVYRELPQSIDALHPDIFDSRVILMLINTEQNKDLLKTIPHREFCDLSIVYRFVANMDSNGISSGFINNEIAKEKGLSEQELYDAAIVNTPKIFPPVIKTIDEVVREITGDSIPEEIRDLVFAEITPEKQMYVISNDMQLYGAACLLYENELHKLAERVGCNLYIIPSSIHDLIAIPAVSGNEEELAEMVAEVNREHVKLEERLSNQVYHYDKNLRKVTLVTDTPYKRLDDMHVTFPSGIEARSR